MFDLTKKLANTINIGGKLYAVYVDFRLWIKLYNDMQTLREGESLDIGYLFKGDKPLKWDISELLPFLYPYNPLPRDIGGSTAQVISYKYDGELIYSAFMQQYGLDLIDIKELHWHKFLALLMGLSESTKLREVMGYRAYQKAKDSKQDICELLRYAWSLEGIDEQDSDELDNELEKFNKDFEER